MLLNKFEKKKYCEELWGKTPFANFESNCDKIGLLFEMFLAYLKRLRKKIG